MRDVILMVAGIAFGLGVTSVLQDDYVMSGVLFVLGMAAAIVAWQKP